VGQSRIPEEAVLEFLEKWIPAAEEMGATFFELTTALAFDWFARQEVDIAVIETGLGGRLDSTNVLTPRVATVTAIGLGSHRPPRRYPRSDRSRESGDLQARRTGIIGESAPKIRSLLVDCAKGAGADPIVLIDDKYRISDVESSRERHLVHPRDWFRRHSASRLR